MKESVTIQYRCEDADTNLVETIDGKTYCRDCVPKKRLIDLGEPTEFDDKATEGADVEIERRCGMVTGASCGHVTLSCQLIDPHTGGVK